jgi:DNA-binding CsgD family transcriptional regulator
MISTATREGRDLAEGLRTQLLTERERDVVGLIALGFETPELATQLSISEHTVRTHVRNAMGKLGARTRAHLVALVLCDHSQLLESGAPLDSG